MHVLVHGRDAGRAAAVVDQIAGSGGTARAVLADLASLEQARELADQVSAEHDGIALLVNNAGVGATGRPTASGRSAPTAARSPGVTSMA